MAKLNGDFIGIRFDFGGDSLLSTAWKDQQTALGAGMLNRCPHERVDQFFQDNLA